MEKTDCFAYAKKGYCMALKKQECDNCSFYKKEKGDKRKITLEKCETCNLKGTLVCKECPTYKSQRA